jgi:hypothetical protein
MRIIMAMMVSLLATAAHAQVINATQGAPMDFATLEIPASGSRFITVSASGSVSGTGSIIMGAVSRAQFRLTRRGGSGGNRMTLHVYSSGAPSGLTLGNFTGIYDGDAISKFPAGNLKMPNSSGRDLFLGATLTYNTAVAENNYGLSYNMDINIE